jgi:nickel/cobalt exporter
MLMGPEQITNLLRQPDWSAPVLGTALAISFALGALHALEPGHGKTLVAAYLVGARGTFRHAMILGGTVTFTHTISVFLLGFATLFLTQYVMPQTIIPVLGVISGLMVIGVGVWLLVKQLRHTHDHHHHHPHQDEVSLGSLITLGASGGLVPCPSALVLLLTSISLGHAAEGLLLLVSFSLGLALVLIAVGAAVVYGKQLLPKRDHHHHGHDHHHGGHHHHHVHWLPIASALVIIAAGIVITASTFQQR